MQRPTQIAIPTLVRIEGVSTGFGIYLTRGGHRREIGVSLQQGAGRTAAGSPDRGTEGSGRRGGRVDRGFGERNRVGRSAVCRLAEGSVRTGRRRRRQGARRRQVCGFSSPCRITLFPTSLSNDGFCSPQSSLTVRGKRRSLPAACPFGVVIDTAVCLDAPRILTLSGIGDLVAKFTAIRDWKLSFHATGEPVDDFAALLSDGSIHAYLSHPAFDLEGIRLLATSLMLNGIAMEICGSSRPASGSEHLISHALDANSARPRLHGLQVGVATYIVSILQKENTERIASLFDVTGFWNAIAEDPFSPSEWLAAVQAAPSIKEGFYTVLSSRNVLPEIERMLSVDPRLARCFPKSKLKAGV